MDRAPVLGDDVSIRVEELLIIGAVEAIAIVADGIQLPKLEPYARWGTRNTTGCPSHVEELDGPAFCVFPSPHANPGCKIGGFDFQSVAVPLRVGFKWWTADLTGIMLMP